MVGLLPIRNIQEGVKDFAPPQTTQIVLDLIEVEGVPQLGQEKVSQI